MLFPLVLIVIGIYMILEKQGIIGGDIWTYVFGVVFILAGLCFFLKKGYGCCGIGKKDKK